jgi:hypothetical protein
MEPPRDDPVRRLLGYTAGIAATLLAPVVLQAAMILRPHTLAAQHAEVAMSLVLAGTVVAVPAMIRAFLGEARAAASTDAAGVERHRRHSQ